SDARLAHETLAPDLRRLGDTGAKDFYRDTRPEPEMRGLVDISRRTGRERLFDLEFRIQHGSDEGGRCHSSPALDGVTTNARSIAHGPCEREGGVGSNATSKPKQRPERASKRR